MALLSTPSPKCFPAHALSPSTPHRAPQRSLCCRPPPTPLGPVAPTAWIPAARVARCSWVSTP